MPALDHGFWYGSYLQTYLERDVRGLNNIGDLRSFQQFVRLLAARSAQTLNMSEFAAALGVRVPTIKAWLSVLEASRIIYLLPPYFRNFGKRITKSPKIYFLDIGLICYLTGISDPGQVMNGPLAGGLFENYIVQETVKCFLHRGKRPQLYYFRSNNGLEVALIIDVGSDELMPVEIKLTKTPVSAMGSGLLRYKALFPNIRMRDAAVVTLRDTTTAAHRDFQFLSVADYWEKISLI